MACKKPTLHIIHNYAEDKKSLRKKARPVETHIIEDNRDYTCIPIKLRSELTEEDLAETIQEIQETAEYILTRDLLPAEEILIEALKILEATEYAVEVAMLKREVAYLRGEIDREQFESERNKVELSHHCLTLRWQNESSLNYLRQLVNV
jgi:hypothetical protein